MPRICSKHQHYDPNCEICQSDIEFPEPSQDDKHSKLLELIAQWEAEANFFGNASDSQADRYAAQAFKRCADELRRIL